MVQCGVDRTSQQWPGPARPPCHWSALSLCQPATAVYGDTLVAVAANITRLGLPSVIISVLISRYPFPFNGGFAAWIHQMTGPGGPMFKLWHSAAISPRLGARCRITPSLNNRQQRPDQLGEITAAPPSTAQHSTGSGCSTLRLLQCCLQSICFLLYQFVLFHTH